MKLAKKFGNMFRAGLCAWLNFPQSPQATQGKHNIAECPGLTCSKLPALRAEKKPTLLWVCPG